MSLLYSRPTAFKICNIYIKGLSSVSVLPTIYGGRHSPCPEKQTGVKLSNVLLWTGVAAIKMSHKVSQKHKQTQ